jgi:hypothetical protein
MNLINTKSKSISIRLITMSDESNSDKIDVGTHGISHKVERISFVRSYFLKILKEKD